MKLSYSYTGMRCSLKSISSAVCHHLYFNSDLHFVNVQPCWRFVLRQSDRRNTVITEIVLFSLSVLILCFFGMVMRAAAGKVLAAWFSGEDGCFAPRRPPRWDYRSTHRKKSVDCSLLPASKHTHTHTLRYSTQQAFNVKHTHTHKNHLQIRNFCVKDQNTQIPKIHIKKHHKHYGYIIRRHNLFIAADSLPRGDSWTQEPSCSFQKWAAGRLMDDIKRNRAALQERH